MKCHDSLFHRTVRALALCLAAFPFAAGAGDVWHEIAPGVLRADGMPAGYALVDGNAAVLIGAPKSSDIAALKARGLNPEFALLTHHNRDSCELAAEWLKAGIPVRAGKKSEAWLSPEGVAKFWDEQMPRPAGTGWPQLFVRYWTRYDFFVHPTGIAGITYDFDGDSALSFRGWRIEVVPTPGHSRDSVTLVARRAEKVDEAIAFCGDALAAPGKAWAPFTMDWNHWQPEGQQTAADSLRRLAKARPTLLCPNHGEPIAKDIDETLRFTADAFERLALLKSFERFTKETLGQPPVYPFLAPEQVGTANPSGNPHAWTRLSPHLFLSGNTYALASKDGPVLLVDAYGPNITQRVAELKQDFGFGPVEAVTVSHAHNDHYTGIFKLAEGEKFQVWALDRIADVIGDPKRFRAPFEDVRPVKVDRRLAPGADGEMVSWHEFRLKFHHHPGQTEYAMGLEVEVDGKRCIFTGDSFYHANQYAGSGGWTAANKGMPNGYASTAQWILDTRPDWILAEHGGPFAFNEEDFRRRVKWAQTAGAAADAVSLSGQYPWDWDLHRTRIEPHMIDARPGEKTVVKWVVKNPSARVRRFSLRLARPGILMPMNTEADIPASEEKWQHLELAIAPDAPSGRHIIPCDVAVDGVQDACDVFFVLFIKKDPAEKINIR